MRYLADTSALVRIDREQVDPEWADVVGQARIAVCEPVLAETLTLADAKQYAGAEEKLSPPIPGFRWPTTYGNSSR
ncbi:hypothetical protein GCM10022251_09970 [Phytohabitans flavus]|uniref:PIN domain-containing protein n=1 Tax=Phytohabitans flavus TaxID=1076124 RepID=A0A6F8XK66_9ACTN|nr:hypothetical protein Pflav_006150 [Phytohabitans flavus]